MQGNPSKPDRDHGQGQYHDREPVLGIDNVTAQGGNGHGRQNRKGNGQHCIFGLEGVFYQGDSEKTAQGHGAWYENMGSPEPFAPIPKGDQGKWPGWPGKPEQVPERFEEKSWAAEPERRVIPV